MRNRKKVIYREQKKFIDKVNKFFKDWDEECPTMNISEIYSTYKFRMKFWNADVHEWIA